MKRGPSRDMQQLRSESCLATRAIAAADGRASCVSLLRGKQDLTFRPGRAEGQSPSALLYIPPLPRGIQGDWSWAARNWAEAAIRLDSCFRRNDKQRMVQSHSRECPGLVAISLSFILSHPRERRPVGATQDDAAECCRGSGGVPQISLPLSPKNGGPRGLMTPHAKEFAGREMVDKMNSDNQNNHERANSTWIGTTITLCRRSCSRICSSSSIA